MINHVQCSKVTRQRRLWHRMMMCSVTWPWRIPGTTPPCTRDRPASRALPPSRTASPTVPRGTHWRVRNTILTGSTHKYSNQVNVLNKVKKQKIKLKCNLVSNFIQIFKTNSQILVSSIWTLQYKWVIFKPRRIISRFQSTTH